MLMNPLRRCRRKFISLHSKISFCAFQLQVTTYFILVLTFHEISYIILIFEESGDKMKNKKLALLLAILSFQSTSNGLDRSKEIAAYRYFKNQKKEINEKIKKLEKVSRNFIVGEAVLFLLITSGSVLAFNKYKEDYKKLYNEYMTGDQAINEIMSRFDNLRELNDHHQIFKGFIEEISKISLKCNQNDYGETTDKEREAECENDAKTKSELEADKTSFRLIAKNRGAVCADYTKVFGYIAQSLGIPCYALGLIPNEQEKDKSGHSILLLADLNDSTNIEKPWKWVIFDGRWFSSKKLKNFANPDGTLPIDSIDRMDEIWGEEFKGGKLSVNNGLLTGWTKRSESICYQLDENDVRTLKEGGYLHVPQVKKVYV